MEALVARLQKIINRLPGPGKLIFGALVADQQAFRILIACIAATLSASLQPPVLSLYTPQLQAGLRDPGSSAPLFVAAGYLLLAVLTLVGGASGDIFGRKRFLLLGLYGVLVTNLLGIFLSQTSYYIWINTLNTISNALVLPMTIALVTVAFPIQVRPFAYGAIFAGQGIALVLASSIYGITEAADLQWLGFVPAILLGIYAIRLVWRDVSDSRAPVGTSRHELVLNVVWAAAIFALVYGLLSLGGGINSINLLVIVSICIIGFVIAYRYVARRLRIANIQLYGVRDLSLAIFAGIMLSVGQASFFYQIGTFFQKIQGVGPVESGLRILPLVLAMMVATFLIVRLSMYFGARRLISGGMLVMAIGTAGLFIIREDTPYWQLLIPILLMGFGFGIATPARTVVVLTVPPHGIVGMSAGVNTAAGQSGFALGTIISSILVTVFARDHFINTLQANNVPPTVIQAVSKAYESIFARVISGDLERLPESVAQAVTVPFSASFSIALGETYLVIGGLLAVAAGVIFLAMNRGLKGTFVNTPLAQKGSVQPAIATDAPTPAAAPNT